jgi:CheY-like chemotaxis protein
MRDSQPQIETPFHRPIAARADVGTLHDILVADDDRDLAEVIVAVLEDEGYTCRHACDGQQALDMVALARPALVLLDMEMPVMSGLECAQKLRALYGRTVPIIIASAAPRALARSGQLEIDGMLRKPFDIDQLRMMVARYVSPRT